MSLQVVLTSENEIDYLSEIAAFVLEKEMYTPYSQLTLTAYVALDFAACAGIYRVELLLDGTQLHFGTVESLRVCTQNGITKLYLVSRGSTAMLLQNQLEPGLHSAMSLDRLMTAFYTFPSEITWEENADTSNYIYVKSNTSMWDGVVGLTYKLYGQYPFVRGANEIRMTLPSDYTLYTAASEDPLVSFGMENNQSLLYSDFYMEDASGTAGAFHENEPEAVNRELVRTKQLSLDQQYLYDPQEALAFRRKFADRRLKSYFVEVMGVLDLSLGDRLSYGTVLTEAPITEIRITGDRKGVRTRLTANQDGFFGT